LTSGLNRTVVALILHSHRLRLDQVPRDIVLVVDDELIVLRTCSIAVARAGFRPIVAGNGAAGLDAFMELKDEICCVLSDIIMPVMNGLEMAERILQIAPHTKILLMSGYSDEVVERQGRNRFEFIRKPFIYSVLVEKIRSLVRPDADAADSAT
jgi:two-component system, cell cycle sensor histidine kinase and response regulator CckA